MAIETAVKQLTHLAHHVTDGESDIDTALRTKTLTFPLMIVDVIDTAQEDHLWVCDRDCTVTYACIIPGVAVTANDTNYKGFQLKTEDGAGSASANITDAMTTKITGGTGDWAQGVPEPFTLSTTTISAGEVLLLAVTAAASGVVCGPYTVQVNIKYN